MSSTTWIERSRSEGVTGRCLLLLAALAIGACGGGGAEDEARRRGDEAWARSDYEEALAEYRLAQRVHDDAATELRVAHAYSALGRVDEAGELYRRAVERDGSLADQAAADLMRLAHDAEERRDRYASAAAAELAMTIQPAIGIGRLALPLARYYVDNGEFDRAVPFYQRAVNSLPPDEAGQVLFEVGRAYERVGDCRRALRFLERFRRQASRRERAEVDWLIGSCSFQLGQQMARAGRQTDALEYIDRTLDLGEPRSVLAQAYFEKGEILARMGQCRAALEAFAGVLRQDPSGGGPLIPRAEQRIDEIRFGKPGAPEGVC